jgi:pyruvate dehydrogenase E1 component
MFRNFADVVIVKGGDADGLCRTRRQALRADRELPEPDVPRSVRGGAPGNIFAMTSATRVGPQLIDRRSDDELLALMSNLGGHDMASMTAFQRRSRPAGLLHAYTIGRAGLPMQATWGQPRRPDDSDADGEVARRRTSDPAMNGQVRGPGAGWQAEAFLRPPFNCGKAAADDWPEIEVLREPLSAASQMSTQQGFGLILNELARGDSELASRIVTTSPDVTVSTTRRLGEPARAVAKAENHDLFKQEKIPSLSWEYSPKGQHLELGIAEMNQPGFTLYLSHP